MTISKGQAWGQPYEDNGTVPVVDSDAELAAAVHGSGNVGSDDLVFSVRSGEVATSLGFVEPRPIETKTTSVQTMVYPMDLGWVELGQRADHVEAEYPFVAHVLGRRSRLSWPEYIVVNAPLVGSLRLGPRAHLNDGLLDVTIGRLPWRQAIEARRRARTGTHLPHPGLKAVRVDRFEFTSKRAIHFTVDGRGRGRWRWARTSIVPDAFGLAMPPPA